MKNIEKVIHNIFRQTGPFGYYKGIGQLVLCVNLALNDENSLKAIQREIYPKVAEISNCEPHCIERNIRKVISAIDIDKFSELVGVNINKNLTPKTLISILVNKIKYDELNIPREIEQQK